MWIRREKEERIYVPPVHLPNLSDEEAINLAFYYAIHMSEFYLFDNVLTGPAFFCGVPNIAGGDANPEDNEDIMVARIVGNISIEKLVEGVNKQFEDNPFPVYAARGLREFTQEEYQVLENTSFRSYVREGAPIIGKFLNGQKLYKTEL